MTGRPGSGKTTLATRLSGALRLPMVSRDQLKEGFSYTHEAEHTELPPETNQKVTDAFFAVIASLLTARISMVVEAAFQHKIWAPALADLARQAEICVIVCDASEVEIRHRLERRLIDDPCHLRFHGVASYRSYEAPKIGAATMLVDSSPENGTSLDSILEFITLASNV